MKKLLLAVWLLLASSSAFAQNNWSYMTCVGTDTAGHYVYLTADSYSPTVNINGDVLRIVGKTQNGKGIVTENFITTMGTLVYDSIVPTGATTLAIYQFNAVTERLLAKANLACRFSGNIASAKAIDMEMFSKLKK